MKRAFNASMLTLPLAILWSCQAVQEDFPASGSVDFSNFYAYGDDFSAGFADGGLYRASQLSAFPNLVIAQSQKAGIATNEFKQPLFDTSQENGSGYYKWTGTDARGLPQIAWVSTRLAIRSTNPLLYTKAGGKYQQLCVPALCVSELQKNTLGSNTGNPFFERILPNNTSPQTYLQLVSQQAPSFFTLWMGNNDVLMNALSGGKTPITALDIFEKNYKELLKTLSPNGLTKGIVFTIPDLTIYSPYFTKLKVLEMGGPTGSSIFYRNGSGQIKKASGNELILLSIDSIGVAGKSGLPKGYAYSYPLSDSEVLEVTEVAKVREALVAFNKIIVAEATAKGLKIINTDDLLKKIQAGVSTNGQKIDTSYPNGGFYSLDGFHFSARGNAIVANEVIKTLNTNFRTRISTVDASLFEGIQKN
jgi:hypothetical protein